MHAEPERSTIVSHMTNYLKRRDGCVFELPEANMMSKVRDVGGLGVLETWIFRLPQHAFTFNLMSHSIDSEHLSIWKTRHNSDF